MNQQITAAEAMEAMERLKIDTDFNRKTESWCASYFGTTREYSLTVELGWGATPLEAVANLLERIGETATVQAEVANAA